MVVMMLEIFGVRNGTAQAVGSTRMCFFAICLVQLLFQVLCRTLRLTGAESALPPTV